MSMMKKIEIDGKAVAFKASAAIPRIYRIKFQRDIYKDLVALEKAIGKDSGNSEDVSSLDLFSLEMFENIAYVMAKHADPSIPDNPEDWLDEFNTFSIYQVLPKLIAQKHRLLAQAVSETREKLETLKTAQQQADEALRNGTISQQQYDGLQREIVETEQELRR